MGISLFEHAVEEGYLHPGFLMIDSPQKNLTPEGGTREDEYGDPAIGSHVWDHLLAVSERLGENAQLLIVDNRPRPQAGLRVVVRYSGVPGDEPYGSDRQRGAVVSKRSLRVRPIQADQARSQAGRGRGSPKACAAH